MKVQGEFDGTVYATAGRDVLVHRDGGDFERVGRLPPPAGLAHRALLSRRFRPLTDRLVGAVPTVNVWPLTATDLLATSGRRVLVSEDGGEHWEAVRELPPSSGPMGVLPPAVAHRDGVTYLGEYPLDSGTTPRVLASADGGRTWSTAVALPDVRHVHAVQGDPYTDDIWLTTGDTDAESRIGRLRDGEFEVVGGGSQDWRAVELAFTPSSILWGVDCAYADANRIYRLDRDGLEPAAAEPTAVHAVDGSVYYAATLAVDGETWAVFSTAMEAGRDSTGPAGQASDGGRGLVVAASSATSFTEWRVLATFRRAPCLGDYTGGVLPRANGYVFLASDPAAGVFLNPYNTATSHGTIRLVSPELLGRRTARAEA